MDKTETPTAIPADDHRTVEERASSEGAAIAAQTAAPAALVRLPFHVEHRGHAMSRFLIVSAGVVPVPVKTPRLLSLLFGDVKGGTLFAASCHVAVLLRVAIFAFCRCSRDDAAVLKANETFRGEYDAIETAYRSELRSAVALPTVEASHAAAVATARRYAVSHCAAQLRELLAVAATCEFEKSDGPLAVKTAVAECAATLQAPPDAKEPAFGDISQTDLAAYRAEIAAYVTEARYFCSSSCTDNPFSGAPVAATDPWHRILTHGFITEMARWVPIGSLGYEVATQTLEARAAERRRGLPPEPGCCIVPAAEVPTELVLVVPPVKDVADMHVLQSSQAVPSRP